MQLNSDWSIGTGTQWIEQVIALKLLNCIRVVNRVHPHPFVNSAAPKDTAASSGQPKQ
ncbi:hypothetical protein ZHAS_00022128 [Anopheles sinensis]|uniref:Uncharacterized protein n=1 Tax=Anopheles sinensis TaxID=74873 RepID=A0A084WU54_ANOSI|nr:hypothetical protein ZHAS_00022128 [Anopheles sinensis]